MQEKEGETAERKNVDDADDEESQGLSGFRKEAQGPERSRKAKDNKRQASRVPGKDVDGIKLETNADDDVQVVGGWLGEGLVGGEIAASPKTEKGREGDGVDVLAWWRAVHYGRWADRVDRGHVSGD